MSYTSKVVDGGKSVSGFVDSGANVYALKTIAKNWIVKSTLLSACENHIATYNNINRKIVEYIYINA